jgi:hypothetical protein
MHGPHQHHPDHRRRHLITPPPHHPRTHLPPPARSVLTSHEEAEAEYALVVKVIARLIKKDAAAVVVRRARCRALRCCTLRCCTPRCCTLRCPRAAEHMPGAASAGAASAPRAPAASLPARGPPIDADAAPCAGAHAGAAGGRGGGGVQGARQRGEAAGAGAQLLPRRVGACWAQGPGPSAAAARAWSWLGPEGRGGRAGGRCDSVRPPGVARGRPGWPPRGGECTVCGGFWGGCGVIRARQRLGILGVGSAGASPFRLRVQGRHVQSAGSPCGRFVSRRPRHCRKPGREPQGRRASKGRRHSPPRQCCTMDAAMDSFWWGDAALQAQFDVDNPFDGDFELEALLSSIGESAVPSPARSGQGRRVQPLGPAPTCPRSAAEGTAGGVDPGKSFVWEEEGEDIRGGGFPSAENAGGVGGWPS